MTVNLVKAKLALRMLTEGMSIRATERVTGGYRPIVQISTDGLLRH